MLDFEDENGAGPSNPVPFHDDPDSGSEFAIEDAEPETLDDLMYLKNGEEPDDYSTSVSPVNAPFVPSIESQSQATSFRCSANDILATCVSSSRSHHHKMYTLPTPSVHHRHRAVRFSFAQVVSRDC